MAEGLSDPFQRVEGYGARDDRQRRLPENSIHNDRGRRRSGALLPGEGSAW